MPVTVGATHSGVDAVLATAGRVSGTVADAGGPLPRVSVAAYAPDGSGGWALVNSASTRADGTYDLGGLAPGDYSIRFADSSGDHVPEYYDDKPTADAADPVTVAAGATTPGVDALLEPAGHITGTVTDGSAGLTQMVVTAWRDAGGGVWDAVKRTATRDGGVYHLGGLSSGDYRIQFTDLDQVYAPEYYDDVPWIGLAADVTVVAGSTTTEINAVLALSGHIQGTVTDTAASPVEGMDVIAYRPDGAGGWEECGSALTGADGSYDVPSLPPGTYKVGFDVRSSELGYAPEFYDDHASLAQAGVVTVRAGEATLGIDAVVDDGGYLDGQVSNEEGWTDATVSVYGPSDSAGLQWDLVAETYTSDGYYRLVLSPGDYKVRFSASSYATEYNSDEPTLASADPVTVTALATTHVDAELSSGAQIWGTVTGGDVAPLAGVEVSAYRDDGHGEWDDCADTTTRADGHYVIDGLAAGTYRIRFRDPAGGHISEYYRDAQSLTQAQSLPVAASSSTYGIDAELAQGGHVTGRVTDGSSGLAGIAVTAYRASDGGVTTEIASTRSRSGGVYDLGGLPTGSYAIEFRDDGERFATQYYSGAAWPEMAAGVSVTVGSVTAGVDAALAPGGGLSGTVAVAAGSAKSLAGTAAAGMRVTAYRSSASGWKPAHSVLTSRSGAFAFAGLAADTYRIQFADPAGELATAYFDGKVALSLADPVTVESDATTAAVDAELAAGGRVAGTVTDSVGAGLPGIAVTAEWLGPAGWCAVATAQTNADGSYEITGLPPATYRVGFVDPTGGYLAEYYDEQAAAGLAAPVVIVAHETTPSIDATLDRVGVVVTAPTAVSSWPSGSTQTVAWTVSPAVSGGEFRVSLVSSGGHLVCEQAGAARRRTDLLQHAAHRCRPGRRRLQGSRLLASHGRQRHVEGDCQERRLHGDADQHHGAQRRDCVADPGHADGLLEREPGHDRRRVPRKRSSAPPAPGTSTSRSSRCPAGPATRPPSTPSSRPAATGRPSTGARPWASAASRPRRRALPSRSPRSRSRTRRQPAPGRGTRRSR